jgi:hypothetical protein
MKSFLLLTIFAGFACAQSVTADLVVQVTDPSGAVIAGAALELTQVETNTKFKAATDSAGNYIFVQLRPGEYSLNVTAPGFQPQTVSGIRLEIGQRARVDVKLAVGALTETVNVVATEATLINAESANIGQVIESKTIVELPLNGRNFIQLAQISAGAIPIGIGVSPATSWTGRSDSTLSIAGGRESQNSFLLNGIETRNARFGSVGIRPSVDAIQEFKVHRSTFSAELGRSSAIINTTLKSGSNEVHGTLFEFLRNRNLDANNFFNNAAGRSKAPFTQNNFGGSIGGPVWIPKLYNGRDRTFWFFNYEGFRQREGITSTGLYPSRAQLAGNLADDSAGTGFLPRSSDVCQANPASRKCVDIRDPFTGLPFPGNIIPASRIDPIVAKVLPYIPAPNVTVPVNTPNFPTFNTFGAPKWRNDFDQVNLRIDHRLSDRDHLDGSFSWADEDFVRPALRPKGGEQFPQSDRLVTFTWNRIFTPRILNEFRFGYNRSATFRLAETSYGPNLARDEFGIKNPPDNPIAFGVPSFGIAGFSAIGSLSQAIGALDENFQFTDNFSVVFGKHNVRAGFQISKINYFQVTNFSGNPSFTFDGRYTIGVQGFGLGDFLLGIPGRASGALGDSAQDMRSKYLGGYLQDDWRITPYFTLNMGLRYEYTQPPRDINNRAMYFNPEQARVILAGQGVRPEIVDPDFNNFAPRLGFTLRPGFLGNFVIRGGAGIYYTTDNWNEEQFKINGPPFFQAQTLEGDLRTPTLFMRDMLPPFTAGPNLSPFTFDRRNRTPYLGQWSFGVQKSLGPTMVLELDYTGSTGQKLPQRRNLNAGRIDPTGTIPLSQRVPYPQYGTNMLLTYNGGWSSYNALTARLERRFAGGFYLLGSYTWQHAIDLGATDEFSAHSQEFKKFDKGNSTFDVRHRLVASYVYELPFGRGKALFAGVPGLLDRLIGGWQINGISTFSTGQYRTVTLGVDYILVGAFSQSRPDVVGDPKAGRMLPDRYFNPAAFDYPRDEAGRTVRRQGNAGRNAFQMPGIHNWDLGVFKNNRINERVNLQFRWEMFNAFNRTHFGVPNLSSTSPNFGRITGTLIGPRRMQFGLKLVF